MDITITKKEYDAVEEYIRTAVFENPCVACKKSNHGSIEDSVAFNCDAEKCELSTMFYDKLDAIKSQNVAVFDKLKEYIDASIKHFDSIQAFSKARFELMDSAGRRASERSKFTVIDADPIPPEELKDKYTLYNVSIRGNCYHAGVDGQFWSIYFDNLSNDQRSLLIRVKEDCNDYCKPEGNVVAVNLFVPDSVLKLTSLDQFCCDVTIKKSRRGWWYIQSINDIPVKFGG